MRICFMCKHPKEDNEFYSNRRKPEYTCKDCKSLLVDMSDKDRRQYASKYWRFLNGERMRLKQYGITLEHHSEMLEKQNNACAICKEVTDKKLFIDHCHTSGKVRGLLCQQCNTGLGNFRDNPTFLLAAIEFLA